MSAFFTRFLLMCAIPILVPVSALSQDRSEVDITNEVGSENNNTGWKIKHPRLHGYIQFYYKHSIKTGSDSHNDNPVFTVQRARLGISGDVLPWVSYELEINPISSNLSALMKDAYIGLHFIAHHELRLGQQKTQFGWENLQSSTRHYFVNRTEMAENLARGANIRDVGLGLVGHIPVSRRWRIEDGITVTNGEGVNIQNDSSAAKNIFGRLGVRYKTKKLKLCIGVSGGYGDIRIPEAPNTGAQEHMIHFWRTGADCQIDHRWFFWAGEFTAGKNDIETFVTVDPNNPAAAPLITQREKSIVTGWTSQIAIKTPIDFGPVFRFDAEGAKYNRYTFGLYYGKRKARFRVLANYELRKVMDDVRGDDKFYLWVQARF
jgi:hypothetical protein